MQTGNAHLNSKLEWQGAEFLVLAHLLIERIEAYKPYVNHASYDLVAINPAKSKQARISVKSRWATNRAGRFVVGSLDCDFVVHVALNRGHRMHGQTLDDAVGKPEIYVFPVRTVIELTKGRGRFNIGKLSDQNKFLWNWRSIQNYLEL